jgi:ribosomal protein S18 acetylase RimI-like enzyme
VLQIVNIFALFAVYGGVVFAHLFVVEQLLRIQPRRGVIIRAGLSVVHALIGYAFFLGIVIQLNVIVHGDYRKWAFGTSSTLIPACGMLFGLLVPWLPLLGGRPKARAEWPPSDPSVTRGRGPMIIRPFDPAAADAVVALWERCQLTRPWNDPHKDIRRKLLVQPELFLVGVLDGIVVATVMAGYDGHRGWINYLGVDPDHQRKGLGRAIMEEAEQRLRAAGAPKINLQVRSTNTAVIAFYRSLGYAVDEVMSMGKRLEHDDGQGQTPNRLA